MIFSKQGIDKLIEFEVGAIKNYSGVPHYPGGKYSGVTIGIGYDLGLNVKEEVNRIWRGWIPDNMLIDVLKCTNIRGEKAGEAVKLIKDTVFIPINVAKAVFLKDILPLYVTMIQGHAPKIDEVLNPDAKSMILSLVYNRGAHTDGESRVEMKRLWDTINLFTPSRSLTEENNKIQKVSDIIWLMRHLWENGTLGNIPGLVNRRRFEADFIRYSRIKESDYFDGDIIEINGMDEHEPEQI